MTKSNVILKIVATLLLASMHLLRFLWWLSVRANVYAQQYIFRQQEKNQEGKNVKVQVIQREKREKKYVEHEKNPFSKGKKPED
jgi:hypothetical protein